MELCPSSLRQWIEEEDGNQDQSMEARRRKAVHKFHHICSGVEYMHSHDVIHRDLKPENIMVGRDGTMKITDFDIATYNPYTRHTTDQGTELYQAPEQERNHYDKSVDIFALGTLSNYHNK